MPILVMYPSYREPKRDKRKTVTKPQLSILAMKVSIPLTESKLRGVKKGKAGITLRVHFNKASIHLQVILHEMIRNNDF